MLNYIHLENFRAFGKPTTIPLAPITLFFGENSAGKTSILHALSLLKQSAETDGRGSALVVRDPRGLVDLGSFEELIFDHDLARVLRIGIGWQNPLSARLRGASNPEKRALHRWELAPESASSMGKEWGFRFDRKVGVVWDSVAMTDGTSAEPLLRLRALSDEQALFGDDPELPLREALEGSQSFGLAEDGFAPREFESARALLYQHRAALAKMLAEDWASGALHVRSQWRARAPVASLNILKPIESLKKVVELMESERPADDALRTFLADLWRGAYRISGWNGPTIFGQIDILDLIRSRLPKVADETASRAFAQSVLLNPARSWFRRDAAARHELERFSPIGPFRQPAARLYTHSGVNPSGVGRRGELVADLLHGDADALKRTNDWLRTFGVNYQLKLRTLGARRSDVFEVRLQDTRRAGRLDVAFTDVGFGISQMLPIVVQCVGTKERIISIEQPEVHIHPRLQSEVGDLLVDCVKNNGHQFLVETHSEHLILRLRRLVREGKVKPEEISVVYVDRGRDGSVVQRIGIKPDGTFDREWPGGFFPERMRELL